MLVFMIDTEHDAAAQCCHFCQTVHTPCLTFQLRLMIPVANQPENSHAKLSSFSRTRRVGVSFSSSPSSSSSNPSFISFPCGATTPKLPHIHYSPGSRLSRFFLNPPSKWSGLMKESSSRKQGFSVLSPLRRVSSVIGLRMPLGTESLV
jgi:hypothetical protein